MPPDSRLNGGYVYRERLGCDAGSLTVIRYLTQRYRHSTADEWRARLERGQVLVDGAPVASETTLRRGQLLQWRRPPWREPPAPLSFAVLHLDADLLAVAKPSGLPTVPGGGFLDHTLLSQVRRRYPGATPAHRLGRGTSGVVLFARSMTARQRLASAWRANAVTKIYRALISGCPPVKEIDIDQPIGPVPFGPLGTVFAASRSGKPSRSRVRVLERRDTTTLVEVAIDTGRPHQIRIHLAAAGHPLAGEPFYVAGGTPAPSSRALPGDTGYRLHAMRLGLSHPVTGRPFWVECLPPETLRFRE